MPRQFYEQFDEATKLKVRIFREYFREWLPVFLAPNSRKTRVQVCDYFCGPGSDAVGNLGSSLGIAKELSRMLNDPSVQRRPSLEITVRFNDRSQRNIQLLTQRLAENKRHKLWSPEISCMDFKEALDLDLSGLMDSDTASFVILDQFGIKAVTGNIFKKLAACPSTDILFFISSETIKRFISLQEIRQYIGLRPEELTSIPREDIHRFICNRYYRGLIERNQEYYLAPFSIRKAEGKNTYGIIFGSSSLLGLDKFLNVSWRIDSNSGEANYNIDRDPFWKPDEMFFGQQTQSTKRRIFEEELRAYISRESPNNHELYRFVLESGFLPKHARSVLRPLQLDGKLEVVEMAAGQHARKGAFYLSYKHYAKMAPQVRFTLIEAS